MTKKQHKHDKKQQHSIVRKNLLNRALIAPMKNQTIEEKKIDR
jgi:hypothetical protein